MSKLAGVGLIVAMAQPDSERKNRDKDSGEDDHDVPVAAERPKQGRIFVEIVILDFRFVITKEMKLGLKRLGSDRIGLRGFGLRQGWDREMGRGDGFDDGKALVAESRSRLRFRWCNEFKRLSGDPVNGIEGIETLGDVGGEAAKEFGVGGGECTGAEGEGGNESANFSGDDNGSGYCGFDVAGKVLSENQAGLGETLTANALARLNGDADLGSEAEGGPAKVLAVFEEGDGDAIGPSRFVGEVGDFFQLVEENAGALDGDEIADRSFLYRGNRFPSGRRFGDRSRTRAAEWFGTHTKNSATTERSD